MTKIKLVVLIWFLFLILACNPDKFIRIENLGIAELHGMAFQRGKMHGSLLKSEIDTIVTRWKNEVEQNINADFETIRDNFLAYTNYVESIEKYCPELLDEVKGIAIGAEQDFNTILAFQMSEELEHEGEKLFLAKCTSLSRPRTEKCPTLVAQNMDPPRFLHGFPTLLHIVDEHKNESYVYTVPGLIGLCGMSKNVSIACNGISMLNNQSQGLPVAFIVRKILTAESEIEAFKTLKTIPHATPQCYTVGGLNSAKCFECSANSVSEFRPFADREITFHTNFAAANRDFSQQYIDLLGEYGKTTNDPYFCPRYFWMYDQIKAMDYRLNIQNIKSLLSSKDPEIHPVSNENTYGSLIMEMGKNKVLYIAPGRPDQTNFLTINF